MNDGSSQAQAEKHVEGPAKLVGVRNRHERRSVAAQTRSKMPAEFRNEVNAKQVAAYLATKAAAPDPKVSL